MRFPKVLIISEFSFNSNSGGGLLFKNLFDGYPKNKIGIIHEDTMFEGKNFGLSICLKSRNKLFNIVVKFIPNKLKNFLKSISFFIKKIQINDPVYNNFPHKESIKEFSPDIIYTIFGGKELMYYIKNVHQCFGYSLIIHFMDNWVSDNLLNEKENKKLLKYFIKAASTRIAINQQMAEAYLIKFNKQFKVIHNCLDRKKIKKINNLNKKKTVTYIGSVYKNAQLDSLVKISHAVIALHRQNIDIKFEIYLPERQLKEFKLKFPKHFCINLKSNKFTDNEYFSLLSKSNLLILASNFDTNSISYYKYSWPAKMPSYLMSGIPIFILGPAEVFFISEAKKKNWAYVCNDDDESNIKESIYKILFDNNIKKIVVKSAIKESKKFELDKMKKSFLNILCENCIKI